MMNVGYELYSKMVSKYVARLKGENTEEPAEDASIEISRDAYIPDGYTGNEAIKLNLYKRIIDIHTEGEAEELLEEMRDRFGEVPAEVRTLVSVSLARSLAAEAGISRIYEAGGYVFFDFRPDMLPPREKIAAVAGIMGGNVIFGTREKGFIKITAGGDGLAGALEVLKQLVK